MSDENQTEQTPEAPPLQGTDERAAEQQLPENTERPLNIEPLSSAAESNQGTYREYTDEDGNEKTEFTGHKPGSPVVRPEDDASTAEAVEDATEARAEQDACREELNDAVCTPVTTDAEANYASRNNIVPPEYP